LQRIFSGQAGHMRNWTSNQADRPACFRVPGSAPAQGQLVDVQVRLRAPEAEALATLLPLLGCGEEAAAIAFDGLKNSVENPSARIVMSGIAAEERAHDNLLKTLIRALPPSCGASDVMRQSRRFHISLGRGGLALHLSRIAAIDAAVCTMLSRLLRTGAPLGRDSTILAILGRIRSDEARHVRASRSIVMAERLSPGCRDAAAAAREALANILMLEAKSFETLCVDPDALFRDLSHLPNGLLAA